MVVSLFVVGEYYLCCKCDAVSISVYSLSGLLMRRGRCGRFEVEGGVDCCRHHTGGYQAVISF